MNADEWMERPLPRRMFGMPFGWIAGLVVVALVAIIAVVAKIDQRQIPLERHQVPPGETATSGEPTDLAPGAPTH
jgi:hypothetical protein